MQGEVDDEYHSRRVGTLIYTKGGLASLFIWLLWGNFCITFLDRVIPALLPLQLDKLQAPNWLIAVIMTSIPTAIATIVSPVVGYKSDRFRSPAGRRLPFMRWAAPFAALFLVLLAFASEIGSSLHHVFGGLGAFSESAKVIVCLALFMGGFKFFELINSMVFTFLINDVVPSGHLTRFYALAQMGSIVAAALFNFLLFKYLGTHLKSILLFSSALYLIGSVLVVMKVKEGEYPALETEETKGQGFLSSAKVFFSECFSHRLYWYYFLHTACWNLGGASAIFTLLLNLSLGITLEQFGLIQGAAMILTGLLLYPAGILADRYHPLRVMVWVKSGILVSTLLNMIWLVRSFTPETNFYILVGLTVIALPLTVLYTAAFNPMIMRILPASRFGQFTSACVMILSVFSIFSSVLVGAIFDVIRDKLPAETWGENFCYRFIPVWSFIFFALGLVFLLLLFREWKRLGGDANYKPPVFE